MHCRCCHSLMVPVRSQNNSSSRQEWHECPVCHRVNMTSTPQQRFPDPQQLKSSLGLVNSANRRVF